MAGEQGEGEGTALLGGQLQSAAFGKAGRGIELCDHHGGGGGPQGFLGGPENILGGLAPDMTEPRRVQKGAQPRNIGHVWRLAVEDPDNGPLRPAGGQCGKGGRRIAHYLNQAPPGQCR